jgi:pantetheine-phosphate adenylyltransferase
MQYQTAALGGTFDHFHRGHEHFLSTAFAVAKQVIIGITTNVMVKDKLLAEAIEPYPDRLKSVKQFLANHKLNHRAEIISLADPFGPTLSSADFPSVLVVTPHTLTGAQTINQLRLKQHLPPLPLITADLIVDETGAYLSSTRIRQGVINRQGKIYQHLFSQTITPTPRQRAILAKPQGQLFRRLSPALKRQINSAFQICVVGDVATQLFLDNRLPLDSVIVDGATNRLQINVDYKNWLPSHVINSLNPPGTITMAAAAATYVLVQYLEEGLLHIDGEEDLLAITALLSLPLGGILIYGQPHQGLVVIEATETSKDYFATLIGPKK